MVKKLLVLVGLVLLVGMGALAFGIGDFAPSSQDDAQATDPFPTETASQNVNEGGETTSVAGHEQAFSMSIDDVQECGETCRDVTTTLTNQQSSTATDVTVYTRIFAGNGTDGDVIWSGEQPVGSLEPSESVTATKRVELSLTDAYAVREADGWITIQTTIQSETETMTVTQHRDVI